MLFLSYYWYYFVYMLFIRVICKSELSTGIAFYFAAK